MVKKAKIKDEKVFSSMIDFKKKYLPKSIEKEVCEKDINNLGICWAKESFDKIKDKLEK